ncbi:PREDICTED: uncharacterized protein LOC104822151 [Tarenaya hassleriana]|uniref:uncharacterized protein LOC104822151 n=1 Tax=Tarenaya hassleriana TaxID=28532 RepID=UPI00053C5C7A|nr:PREDICTED: uncharacterized protein LOC104822151 [Tarenaya hassleriana]
MGDQPQQVQQPLVVYPNTFTKQYPDPSSSTSPPTSSGSSGSFGTVFIVLAVILVLSALACVFGRICNRGRLPKQQQKNKQQHEKASKKSREIRPVEREPRENGDDLEFGFDMKRPPMPRPGDGLEFGFDNKRGGPPQIKHGVRFKMPEDGSIRRGDLRHGHGPPDIEFKP